MKFHNIFQLTNKSSSNLHLRSAIPATAAPVAPVASAILVFFLQYILQPMTLASMNSKLLAFRTAPVYISYLKGNKIGCQRQLYLLVIQNQNKLLLMKFHNIFHLTNKSSSNLHLWSAVPGLPPPWRCRHRRNSSFFFLQYILQPMTLASMNSLAGPIEISSWSPHGIFFVITKSGDKKLEYYIYRGAGIRFFQGTTWFLFILYIAFHVISHGLRTPKRK